MGRGAEGIVHRDLKPENIFVTPEGRTTAPLAAELPGTSKRRPSGNQLAHCGSIPGMSRRGPPRQAESAEGPGAGK